jgi:hypothetical protein
MIKDFASMSSRSNHIKRIHKYVKENVVTSDVKNVVKKENVVKNVVKKENNVCKYCDKRLADRITRWKHEQKCKEKTNENDNKITNHELNELKKQNIEIIKQNEELKLLLQKALKIHPKTLQKINSQLNNTNNGTINNGTIINIVPLGQENLEMILSQKEKMKILNRKGNSLTELVDLVHISDKYKQFIGLVLGPKDHVDTTCQRKN